MKTYVTAIFIALAISSPVFSDIVDDLLETILRDPHTRELIEKNKSVLSKKNYPITDLQASQLGHYKQEDSSSPEHFNHNRIPDALQKLKELQELLLRTQQGNERRTVKAPPSLHTSRDVSNEHMSEGALKNGRSANIKKRLMKELKNLLMDSSQQNSEEIREDRPPSLHAEKDSANGEESTPFRGDVRAQASGAVSSDSRGPSPFRGDSESRGPSLYRGDSSNQVAAAVSRDSRGPSPFRGDTSNQAASAASRDSSGPSPFRGDASRNRGVQSTGNDGESDSLREETTSMESKKEALFLELKEFLTGDVTVNDETDPPPPGIPWKSKNAKREWSPKFKQASKREDLYARLTNDINELYEVAKRRRTERSNDDQLSADLSEIETL